MVESNTNISISKVKNMSRQTKNKIAVALVCDERLATQAGAVAFKINSDWNFDVHIFVETNSTDIKHFYRVEREGITYHINRLLNDFRDILPKMDKYPIAVWGRIFLPEVLSDYARILYVDVDILPGPKPIDLDKIDLPYGIGMVSNYWTRYNERIGHRRTIEHMSQLGLKAEDYFNSGVILMDPSKIIADEVGDGLARFVSDFGDKIKSPDQDFLAFHYKGKITQLSVNLNFIQPLMGFGLEGGAVPCIRHYVMQPKFYETLDNFGSNSIIRAAQSEFLDLLGKAQLPVELLAPRHKPKFSRLAKSFLRGVTANTLLGAPRRSRKYREWEHMRSIMLDLLLADEERCADRLPFTLTISEPQVHWTGSEFICIRP